MDARTNVDVGKLRADVGLSWNTWSKQMGGLQMIVLREKGVDALVQFKLKVLGSQQEGYYLQGLKKLGIDNDTPAVAAAKYHYLSNRIGGVNLEYIEESPKKAWIRYTPPNVFYAGMGVLAIPAAVQRAVFAAWHAHNAKYMKCPNLGYVCTKIFQDGAPYDEGYFIEYDEPVAPHNAVRYEHVSRSPEYDADKAPKLDPAIWPEARQLRAKRKYAGSYVRTAAESLLNVFGEKPGAYMIELTLSAIGMQYAQILTDETGVEGRDVHAIAALLHRLLEAREDDATLETLGDTRAAITMRSYKPFEANAEECVRQAFFAFPRQITRILNGRVRITRAMEGPETEVWTLEDTGAWLY